jgi:hypothetical protein
MRFDRRRRSSSFFCWREFLRASAYPALRDNGFASSAAAAATAATAIAAAHGRARCVTVSAFPTAASIAGDVGNLRRSFVCLFVCLVVGLRRSCGLPRLRCARLRRAAALLDGGCIIRAKQGRSTRQYGTGPAGRYQTWSASDEP